MHEARHGLIICRYIIDDAHYGDYERELVESKDKSIIVIDRCLTTHMQLTTVTPLILQKIMYKIK